MNPDAIPRTLGGVARRIVVTELERQTLIRAVTALRVQAARHSWAGGQDLALARQRDADILARMVESLAVTPGRRYLRIIHSAPTAQSEERYEPVPSGDRLNWEEGM